MNKQTRNLSVFLAVLIAATGILASCSNMLTELKPGQESPVSGETVLVADYYVSPAGNDANAGTKALPLLTIQAAIDKCSGSTLATIAVAAGTYAQGTSSLTLKSKVRLYGGFNSDFSARDNVARTNATYQTKITSAGAGTIVNCGNKSNITIDGFYLGSADINDTNFFSASGSGSNISITNNTIVSTGAVSGTHVYGINFGGSTDTVSITNNIVDFSGKTNDFDIVGIWLYNTTGEVADNAITLGTQTTASRKNLGIMENGTTATTRLITINKNTVNLGAFSAGNGFGIRADNMTGAGSNAIITNNTITATDVVSANILYAVYIDGTTTASIANNTVSFTGIAASSVYAMNTSGTTNAKFYNNSIYVNIPCSGWPVGFYLKGTGPDAKNNIVWLEETDNEIGFQYDGATSAQATYNSVYLSGGGSDPLGTLYDASNIIGTAPVLSIASDLRFTGTSPAAITAGGTNLYAEGAFVRADKAGATRPSSGAWAMGAYNP